jgi:hypothetical protein
MRNNKVTTIIKSEKKIRRDIFQSTFHLKKTHNTQIGCDPLVLVIRYFSLSHSLSHST